MQAAYDSYNPGGQKRGPVGSLPGHADTRLPRHAGGVRFFDHPSNLELLINDSFMNDLAAAIASGIQDYFKASRYPEQRWPAFSVPLRT